VNTKDIVNRSKQDQKFIMHTCSSTRLMMSNAKFNAEFKGFLTPGQAHM